MYWLIATPGVRSNSPGSDVAVRCNSNVTIQGVNLDNRMALMTINDDNMNPKVCYCFCYAIQL